MVMVGQILMSQIVAQILLMQTVSLWTMIRICSVTSSTSMMITIRCKMLTTHSHSMEMNGPTLMVTAKETTLTSMTTTTIGLTTQSKCAVLTAYLRIQCHWIQTQMAPVTPSILTTMVMVFLTSMMSILRMVLSGKIAIVTDLETMLTHYLLSTT